MFSDHISNSISLELKKNEYGYPHSGALWQFCLKLEHCKPHKAMCHPTKCDIINQTISDSISCDSISQDILSHIFDVIQRSCYKSKCIRITHLV